MTPEQWNRLQELFYAAVDMEPGERSAFLELECGGDQALLREVEALIESSTAETRISLAVQETAASAFEARPGDRIDAWEIVRLIGRGGMGAVYHAVRADSHYKKDVAIKLMRVGLGGEELLARFRAERQILANLDHPNIARLIDGGTAPNGSPYFVIEYVEGVPIDEYCRQHRLSVRVRLELFRRLCEAVIYAHRNLVVHRDIKPANILVTGEGEPKLLDFGIAKPIGGGERHAAATQVFERLMTPEYASPEQVRGEAITTATDVYLLGVLLYELLTEQQPFQLDTATSAEIETTICEVDPKRPALAAPQLRRELQGDLDNIVLMAMRKEPSRRYASVEQFSEDIRRHLEGYPVLARGDDWSYTATKFVRRHRLAVAFSAVFILVLIGFGTAMAILARRVVVERDEARAQQSRAEQVTKFLMDSFRVADRSGQQGRTVTAKEILDRGSDRIATELKEQPGVRAQMMNTMGEVYESLGLYDRAQELLTNSLSTRQQVFGSQSGEVGESLAALGELAETKGDYETAETNYRRDLALQRKLSGERSGGAAEAEARLGSALSRRGKNEESERLLRESLSIRQELFGGESTQAADSLNRLGIFYDAAQKYAEAEPPFREALGIRTRVLGHESPVTANSLSELANLLNNRGKLDEAEQLQREALRIDRKLYGDQHILVADDLHALGDVLFNEGKYQDAVGVDREALAIYQHALGPEHPQVANILIGLGNAEQRRGDLKQAEGDMRSSIEMFRKLLGEHHPETASAIHNLGNLLLQSGDFAQAEKLEQDLVDWSREHGDNSPGHGYNLATLAGAKRARGDYKGADADYRETLEIFRQAYGETHFNYGRALASWGTNLISLGDYKDAEKALRDSRAVYLRVDKPSQLDVSFSLVGLAQVLLLEGRVGEAEKAARQAYDIRRSLLPASDRRVALTESVLGGCLVALHKDAEAGPLLLESHRNLLPLSRDKSLQAELQRLPMARK